MSIRPLRLALVFAGVLGLCATARAETPWQFHHPHRVEVNHRLVNQNVRIHEERLMARQDGGHIGGMDQRR